MLCLVTIIASVFGLSGYFLHVLDCSFLIVRSLLSFVIVLFCLSVLDCPFLFARPCLFVLDCPFSIVVRDGPFLIVHS